MGLIFFVCACATHGLLKCFMVIIVIIVHKYLFVIDEDQE